MAKNGRFRSIVERIKDQFMQLAFDVRMSMSFSIPLGLLVAFAYFVSCCIAAFVSLYGYENLLDYLDTILTIISLLLPEALGLALDLVVYLIIPFLIFVAALAFGAFVCNSLFQLIFLFLEGRRRGFVFAFLVSFGVTILLLSIGGDYLFRFPATEVVHWMMGTSVVIGGFCLAGAVWVLAKFEK